MAGATEQIVITGATGHLGRRVASRLADRGIAQRLVGRDPSKASALPGAAWVHADYADRGSLERAFAGATRLLLVSASEAPDRVSLHTNAVEAAAAAGVGSVVYISFLGASPDATFTFARDHWHTEQAIRRSGLEWTFLRDSIYQDILPLFVGADGVLRGPASNGRVGAVARDDIADVAAGVLTDTSHHGRTYDLTGPERLTFSQIAATIASAVARDVTYRAETIEEAYESRAEYAAPTYEVAGWVSSYAAVAAGELELITDHVTKVAGHSPMHFADYLAANPGVVDALRHRLDAS